MVNELSVEKVRNICNPQLFEGHSREDVAPLENILGQERAVKAFPVLLSSRE